MMNWRSTPGNFITSCVANPSITRSADRRDLVENKHEIVRKLREHEVGQQTKGHDHNDQLRHKTKSHFIDLGGRLDNTDQQTDG